MRKVPGITFTTTATACIFTMFWLHKISKVKKKKRTQKKTKKGVLFSLFLFPKQGENQGQGEDREKKQVATYFAFSHTICRQ